MRKTILALIFIFSIVAMLSTSLCAANAPKLVAYNGGFFKMKKPAGWKVATAGKGCTLAFLVRDPSCSLRQLFDFTEIGPFYVSAQHKASEANYVSSGGYAIQWLDMPVVSPLTVSSFFKNFSAIANTRIAKGFMPNMPKLQNFTVISSKTMPSPMQGFSIEVVRAVFKQDGRVGEGLFTGMVGLSQPYGWGFYITGVTAPHGELHKLEPTLVKSLASFDLSKEYVEKCKREQQENFQGLLRAGKTMDEASDIIIKGWEERGKTDDIIAEKRSDQILGKERFYDPSSGKVYEFEDGVYQRYAGRDGVPKLHPLPGDNYDLWMKPAHDGRQLIR